MVGHHFAVLRLGALEPDPDRSRATPEQRTHHMADGAEPAAFTHELAQVSGVHGKELPGGGAVPRGTAAGG